MCAMESKERGIHEIFAKNSEAADWHAWGRRSSSITRRGFVTGLSTLSALVGARIVFANQMPAGLIPAIIADSTDEFRIEGKNGLTLLNDRPVNAETPAHLLNDKVTPVNRLFIRNNGIPPVNIDPNSWTLKIEGESVVNSKTYTIKDLQTNFENINRQLVLECGGNGRAEFNPPASGNQWTLGAVGCPQWNGVRLKDILEDCGYKTDAVYVAYYGSDKHLTGVPDRIPISRGVPIEKALDPESMIAWGMNGENLHPMNGHPLRLAIGGWPGSVSGKWIHTIVIRDRIHDGTKMAPPSYSVPCDPVAPGTSVSNEDMCTIHSMPVKSLITSPQSGARHDISKQLSLNGHAWAGDKSVAAMKISIDFGQTWSDAILHDPTNPYAWQHWEFKTIFPKPGYYEVWARAIDSDGISQPMVMPNWNPKGYLNNACHRIAIYAS